MNITEKVNVVCVRNVVDNERTRYKLFIVVVVTVIAVRMTVVNMFRVRFVIMSFFAVVTAMVLVFIALLSAVRMGIVLGVLGVCVVLISVAMVLGQKRCSKEDEQGGKQGLK